jgi:hypothetical protein
VDWREGNAPLKFEHRTVRMHHSLYHRVPQRPLWLAHSTDLSRVQGVHPRLHAQGHHIEVPDGLLDKATSLVLANESPKSLEEATVEYRLVPQILQARGKDGMRGATRA